ncbi:MAG: dimethyl sulfoxide reductase anchor subunit [Sedimenticola sp.]|nr:dimethyl sulfoxide reductase anchor subunit [Sedimenticola sp.]
MKPAFSVIFLTTLIGVGQGLFLALYTGEVFSFAGGNQSNPPQMMLVGALLVFVLMVLGVFASTFHLGRPERAWRAATQWRTSWLSREVIVLPAFIVMVALWGGGFLFDNNPILSVLGGLEIRLSFVVGLIAAFFALFLYVCTAMIYVAIKCIQEWASPLTVINYLLLGLASGFTLATALASYFQSLLTVDYAVLSIIFIVAAAGSRFFSLCRNAQIKPKLSAGTALGTRHLQIRQISQGVRRGSFNTSEFFHHASQNFFLWTKFFFLIATFVLPFFLVIFGWIGDSTLILIAAVLIQYMGLLAERWFFFAEANHPQNNYYQG